MGLNVEYFINQTHIKDLQKLKDEELFFIIHLFNDELEYFNNYEGFQLKGLIIACNEMKDLIKDFRFILNGYIEVINKHNIPFNSITDIQSLLSNIQSLLSDMDNIENYINRIKTVRLLKAKVNDLVDTFLLYIRMFYESLKNFINIDKGFWYYLPLEN